ncbi:MAG: response regulator [Proteobacteria bacterium]|nr:response regulator [Pseudomonadota bacterium]MBU1594023.1 response regulator [Pseudomonadota bacterium]
MAKILIAEDDALSQKFVATVVDQMGHSSFVSPDGRHAWEALNSANTFSMLITDIMMPRMDGTTLIRSIRGDPRFATLPIVIMSAFIGIKEIAELLEIGATWFMAKPVDRVMLEDYINRAIK